MIKRTLRHAGIMVAFALSFLTSFLIVKLVVSLTDFEVYARFALLVSFGYGLRVVWFGIVGVTFARGYSIAVETANVGIFSRRLSEALWSPFALLALAAVAILTTDVSLSFGAIALAPVDIVAGLALGASIAAAGALVEVSNAMGRRGLALVAMVYPSLAQLGAVLVLRETGGPTAAGIGALAAVFALVCQVSVWWALLGSPQFVREPADRRGDRLMTFLWRHGCTMLVWIPSGLAMRAADKWIAAGRLDLSDFAAFSVILLLTQGAMAAGASILSRSVLPRIYALAGAREDGVAVAHAHRLVRWTGAGILAGGAVLIAATALFGGDILSLVANDEMAAYRAPLWIAAVGATFTAFAQSQIIHGHIRQRPEVYTLYRYAEAASYMAALVILTPIWGVMGAAFATVVAGAVAVVTAALSNRRLRRQIWQPA